MYHVQSTTSIILALWLENQNPRIHQNQKSVNIYQNVSASAQCYGCCILRSRAWTVKGLVATSGSGGTHGTGSWCSKYLVRQYRRGANWWVQTAEIWSTGFSDGKLIHFSEVDIFFGLDHAECVDKDVMVLCYYLIYHVFWVRGALDVKFTGV